MKVLLIATNMESRMNNRMNAQPLPIGLAYIGGFVDKTLHTVRLIDLMFSDDYKSEVARHMAEFEPDVVGISLRNLSNHSFVDTRWAVPITQEVISIVKTCKNIPVIAGGPGFSALPVPCFDYIHADYGLVGDSGEAFNALVTDLENNSFSPSKYKGLLYRDQNETIYDGGVCSSSFNPRPYYEGLNLEQYNRAGFGIGVLTKLTSWQYGQGQPRASKKPEAIIAELKELSGLDNFRKVFFIDNAFNIPADTATALCEALIEEQLGIHWSTVLSPSNPDPVLIDLMKRAGCVFALITGDETMSVGAGSIYETCHNTNLGFSVNVGFGGIGETKTSFNEKVSFLTQANATISYLRYGVSVMPGTPECQAMIANGSIASDADLIKPHFYLEPEVEPWLLKELNTLAGQNPKWNLS